ncbi:PucR family transcriptional regulator ligand-binding domain-containing protein [Streptomyces sp. NPDC001508]|uniref:PucR family transcriptional regulator n=1 Tax=Streptomyces sp. NPDC001508 TaxID=3154656 RepID=UPI00332DE19A
MITVNGLIASPEHAVTMLAGRGGGDRIITWAHVCDLPDPWSWVRPGDLVMTTGDGLPEHADAQRVWFSTLADAGITGLLLAPRPGAPEPTAAMSAVADERSVPLLTADFTLQFAELSRTIIESALRSERDHIQTARRLFDVYVEAVRLRSDLSARIDLVARSAGWTISVVRQLDGEVLAVGGRVEVDRTPPICVPVPGPSGVEVRVHPDRRRALDSSLVHYLAALVGIELEYLTRAGRERRRQGEVVLRGALDGSVSGGQLRYELAARGMGDRPVVVAVLRESDDGLSRALGPEGLDVLGGDVVPLLAGMDEEWVALLPAGWTGLELFRRSVCDTAHVGLSLPLAPGADVREAYLQARTAAGRAVDTGQTVLDYTGAGRFDALSSRSLTELRLMVDRVLGPVLERDREAGSDLLPSLDVFLRNNGSWTKASSALGVHRQTLVYRIAQIERLTGLRPTSTEGIARFWSALRAARDIGVLPHNGPKTSA